MSTGRTTASIDGQSAGGTGTGDGRASRLALLEAIALVMGVVAVLVPAAPAPVHAATTGCTGANTPARTVRAARRPIILVHGWTGSPEDLTGTGRALERMTGNRTQAFYFDYSRNATTWAGNELVSGCLADYITAVSDAYLAAQGAGTTQGQGAADGKVLLVGHSMGGLASLYAAGRSGVAARVAALITFDTPYTGSPFGNSDLATVKEWLAHHSGVMLPPVGADAGVCLAKHGRTDARTVIDLPAPCRPAPAYLPAGIPVTQISGEITVRRRFLGVHLYDIPLYSDGIVGADSSHGYTTGGRGGTPPRGTRSTLPDVPCLIDADNLRDTIIRAALPHALMVQALTTAGLVLTDDSVLSGVQDQLNGPTSRPLSPGLTAYLLAGTKLAGCSHIHITGNQQAIGYAADTITQVLDQLRPATQLVTLAPVDSHGRPAPGWTTRFVDASLQVDCGYGSPSPSAVSPNIYDCSPAAAVADTCWLSAAGSTMLCLQDPWTRQLAAEQIGTPPSGPVTPPATADPIGLELANGAHCRLRNGGSWSSQLAHPNWFGFYACSGSGDSKAIFAPAHEKMINKASRTWTVQYGDFTHQLQTVQVTRAYVVATAP